MFIIIPKEKGCLDVRFGILKSLLLKISYAAKKTTVSIRELARKEERPELGSGTMRKGMPRGGSLAVLFLAALLTLSFLSPALAARGLAPSLTMEAQAATDGQGVWMDTRGPGKGSIHALVYNPEHQLLYGGTSRGVFKYDGSTWQDIGGGISDYDISSLAYDPDHHLLYAGTSGRGVWKYDGSTWQDTGGGISDIFVCALVHDPEHDLLYAGTSGRGGPRPVKWCNKLYRAIPLTTT